MLRQRKTIKGFFHLLLPHPARPLVKGRKWNLQESHKSLTNNGPDPQPCPFPCHPNSSGCCQATSTCLSPAQTWQCLRTEFPHWPTCWIELTSLLAHLLMHSQPSHGSLDSQKLRGIPEFVFHIYGEEGVKELCHLSIYLCKIIIFKKQEGDERANILRKM